MYCQEQYLKAPGLQKLLREIGALSPRALHDSRGEAVELPDVLDLKTCNPTAWAEHEAHLKEVGVINYAEINEHGQRGVRRDLTELEVEELPLWPVSFHESNEDEMLWFQFGGVFGYGSQVARIISLRFPELVFQYEEVWEDQSSGVYRLKNGKFTLTKRWKKAFEEMLRRYRHSMFAEKLRVLRMRLFDPEGYKLYKQYEKNESYENRSESIQEDEWLPF